MPASPAAAPTLRARNAASLEGALSAVESRLTALGEAMRAHDPAAMETEAAELHRALSSAVGHCSRAARDGDLSAALRHRLAVASARVAAQRESLARATAALDRAIDVLLPEEAPGTLYSSAGAPDRAGRGGLVQA